MHSNGRPTVPSTREENFTGHATNITHPSRRCGTNILFSHFYRFASLPVLSRLVFFVFSSSNVLLKIKVASQHRNLHVWSQLSRCLVRSCRRLPGFPLTPKMPIFPLRYLFTGCLLSRPYYFCTLCGLSTLNLPFLLSLLLLYLMWTIYT